MSGHANTVPNRGSNAPGPPRILSLSGIASVVLSVIAVGMMDHGGKGLSPEMPSAAILAGFQDAAGSARRGAAVIGAAIVANLLFLAVLWDRLRRGAPWLGALALAGGILGTALLAVQAVIGIAGVVAAEHDAAEAARMLLTVEWEYARVGVPSGLVILIAATVAGFRHHVFSRWFNWTSLVFTALSAVALAPVGPAGLIAASGGIWVIIASIVMMRPIPTSAA